MELKWKLVTPIVGDGKFDQAQPLEWVLGPPVGNKSRIAVILGTFEAVYTIMTYSVAKMHSK